MKSFIKDILPNSVVNLIRKTREYLHIKKLYDFDKKRLLKYAYSLNKNISADNLRSKITFHYHAIEKGLSNANLRLGFGERAFKELFWAMDEYIKRGFATDDYRFQSAISVIQSYVQLHDSKSYSVKWVEEYLIKYSKYLQSDYEELGGYLTLKSSELPEFNKLDFKELANSRYSVRDFGKSFIDECKIYEAIDIATKTPSVCNRQSWKVRYIKSPNKIKEVLTLQRGLTGNGENLRDLLLVTTDKQYMNSGRERNQTYIDGGLYTMSLLYALTSLGIASCTLNASFSYEQEINMRDKLNVKDSEDFIAFIAIGTYPDVVKVAKSPRDNYKLFTTVID